MYTLIKKNIHHVLYYCLFPLAAISVTAEESEAQVLDDMDRAEMAMVARLASMDDAQLDRLEAAITQVRAMEPEERAQLVTQARALAGTRAAQARQNRQSWRSASEEERAAIAEKVRKMTPEDRQALREELRDLNPEQRRERMRDAVRGSGQTNRPEGRGRPNAN